MRCISIYPKAYEILVLNSLQLFSSIFSWYFEKCSGSFAKEDQVIFWAGVQSISQILKTISSLPESSSLSVSNSPTTSSFHVDISKRHYSTSVRTHQLYHPMLRFGHQITLHMPLSTRRSSNATAKYFFSQSSQLQTTKNLGLIGARGYTGQELIKLINHHSSLDLSLISSRELAGKTCQEYTKTSLIYSNVSPAEVQSITSRGEIDIWVMALPNGICGPFVEAVQEGRRGNQAGSRAVILDLSADYRFDSSWAYGLPELYENRSRVQGANQVANPGCYATGGQLGIAPLKPWLTSSASPVIFGVSGYSGAGTKPSPKNDPAVLQDNMIPYSLTGHIHENEISYQLGSAVDFIPHVGAWFQGISLTISIPLAKSITVKELHDLYADAYRDESMIQVDTPGEAPLVKDISQKHGVRIGGFGVDSRTGKRAVVVVTIDNLLKGAATQAIQNINLTQGWKELEGIPL
jgi:N-acetyl-gamma-glutamyl-phosphate reductase/acetylglutamate kinase